MKKITRESYYPCRGIFRKTGQIVEFDSFESGVVIVGDEESEVGEYSDNWNMDCFELI